MPKKLSSVSWEPYKVAIIGDSGSGKTSLAASAPGKAYWFCFEQGMMSVARKPEYRDKIEFDDYPVGDMVEGKHSFQRAEANLDYLVANPAAYDVVVIDSLLSLSEVTLDFVQLQEGSQGEPPRGFEAWGKLGAYGNRFLYKFMNLKCNKILICHEEYDKDETTGRMVYKMAAKGKQINTHLPKHFDEIWRTMTVPQQDGSTKYTVLTKGGDSKFKAKSRFDCFDKMEVPNMTDMLAKVKESFKCEE